MSEDNPNVEKCKKMIVREIDGWSDTQYQLRGECNCPFYKNQGGFFVCKYKEFDKKDLDLE
jgi:hypothetical protein